MKLRPSPLALPWVVLTASLLISFFFWHWALHILAPANTAMVQAQGRPMGNNSDLYPRWLGTRELLLHGRDPYSPQVTREIQMGFYGRPLNPQNPADPTAQESFVYPVYVAFLLAPVAAMPFPMAVELFRWLLLAAVALSVPLWMHAVGLRPKWPLAVSAMLLATSSSPAVAEYFQQNLTALVLFLVACAAAALVRNWQVLGGFLLALATVKPDSTAPLVLWFLLWALVEWRQRQRLIWSFAGTMAALLMGAQAVSPHWMGRFLAAVREYPTYGTDPSIIQVLLPSSAAWWVEAGLIVSSVLVCWRWRKAGAGSQQFGWALAWVATVTLAVVPKLAAYNELLLIPALLVLAAHYGKIRGLGLFPRALMKAAFACQIWQWLTATALSVGSILFPAIRLRAVAALPDYTSLALGPLTLLAVILATLARRSEGYSTNP
ncbi:MAG: glycosyltransferase family 87 protein [Terriglobales bacterium]